MKDIRSLEKKINTLQILAPTIKYEIQNSWCFGFQQHYLCLCFAFRWLTITFTRKERGKKNIKP